ncbi:MAG: MFS transporter [Haloarculaceae archaeon]
MDERRRALAIVFGVVFLDLLGFGIIVPILPFYTRSFPGGTEFVIGLLAASYSAMQFLAAPVLGSLSDQYGRRPVIVLSLAGGVVAWTLFGLAEALWTLFLARSLAGAMGGNLSATQAYVADITPREERASALGLLGAAFGMGFVFGPGIGAVLSFDTTVAAVDAALPAVVPVNRFSLPSFAAAAMSLAGAVVALVFLPESRTLAPDDGSAGGPGTDRPSQVAMLVEAVRSAALRPLLTAFFVTSFAFSGVTIMFIPFVADVFGYTASQSALLLTYIGVLSVLVQGVLVGPLTARYSSRRLAPAGAALLAVGLVGLPATPLLADVLPDLTGLVGFLDGTLLALLLVLAVLPAGNGVLNVSLTALVSTTAAGDRQGSAFGVTQGAGSLARTVGPIVMGGLYTLLGYRAPFLLGAVLLLPVLFIATRLGEPPGPVEPRPVDPGQAR